MTKVRSTRYIYFRDSDIVEVDKDNSVHDVCYYLANSVHTGIVSVGFKIVQEDEDLFIYYTCSFCAPNDRFSKVTSRELLEKKFNNNQVTSIPIDDEDIKYRKAVKLITENFNCNLKEVCNRTMESKRIPSWFKRLRLRKK